MRTRLVVAVLPLAALGLVAGPSHAEKKVEKSWTATAPVPDVAGLCDGTVPGATHEEEFTAPAAGKLTARISGYPIDWDLYIRDVDGGDLAAVTSFNEKESVATVKLKAKQQVIVIACNVAGGPTSTGSYVFVY